MGPIQFGDNSWESTALPQDRSLFAGLGFEHPSPESPGDTQEAVEFCGDFPSIQEVQLSLDFGKESYHSVELESKMERLPKLNPSRKDCLNLFESWG